VAFSHAAYSISEGDGVAVITVTLSAPSGKSVTVDYATADGTATAWHDYTPISGTLAFASGVTTQTFSVSILDDALDEDDEIVILTLANAVNATLTAPNPATLTIVDDDDPPAASFSQATYSMGEGESTAVITITLSAPSGKMVTVGYATSDGTATAGQDYTPISGTLTFASWVTVQTFSVTILDDALDEDDETVILTLANAVNATLGSPNPAILTLVDDDAGLPSVAFSQAVYTVSMDADAASITVTLNTPSDRLVTVDYIASQEAIVVGNNQLTHSGTLTFTPGVVLQTFVVMLPQDGGKTIQLTLTNPVNATLGTPSNAVLTIEDTRRYIFLPLVLNGYR